MVLTYWYRSEKQILTDEVCNAIEVHAKQSIWLDCGESAGLSSRGMYIEMHQELERSEYAPEGTGRDVCSGQVNLATV